MFKLPQDVTVNNGHKQNTQHDILAKYIQSLNGSIDLIRDDSQFIMIGAKKEDKFYVIGLATGNDIAPKPFFDPIQVFYNEMQFLIIDVRPCTVFNRSERRHQVNNLSLFHREKVRVLTQAQWMLEGSRHTLAYGAFPIKLFGLWIAETVGRHFALDPLQQLRLTLAGGLYYLSLFTTEDAFDIEKASVMLSRIFSVRVDIVTEIANEVGFMATLTDFISKFSIIVSTDRLKGLTIDVFVNILLNAWVGANRDILIAEALEYPPVWSTLLYLGCNDRSARITGIARLAEKFQRDPASKEFVQLVTQSVDDLDVDYED